MLIYFPVGHPLIHLGYAYEMSSREIGIEALSLVAGGYSDLHKYFDDPSYTKPSPQPSTSPLEILHRLSADDRLKDVFNTSEEDNFERVPEEYEPILLEYWNSWTIEDPVKQFQESQEAAVTLLVSTVTKKKKNYDFFLVHLLTTSHAVRILLPLIPGQFHISLVRQWWLLTLTTYIGQKRPKIDEGLIDRVDLKGKSWKYCEDKAVNGKWATDAHFVKGTSLYDKCCTTSLY
jgi:hypothetical protein